MGTIKTAKYLVGAKPVNRTASPRSAYQLKYSSIEEFVEEEGFVITSPGQHKLSKTAFGDRPKTYPNGIKHIFLHHTATKNSLSNGDIISIFNRRSFKGSYASSHRGIAYNGSEEKYMDDAARAYCQGLRGYSFNYSGMSVELISLGYLIDVPIQESDGIYYRQYEDHAKKYWVKKENSALAVDFNGKEKPFKGFARWDAYSQAQVNATVKLIKEWCSAYKIPFTFDQNGFNAMFMEKANPKFITDNPGVYSHCSVTDGKFDIYPDPLLVKTFKKEFPPGNAYSKF